MSSKQITDISMAQLLRSEQELVRLAKKKARAYVCNLCPDKVFADIKLKFDAHHIKFHARPAELPSGIVCATSLL